MQREAPSPRSSARVDPLSEISGQIAGAYRRIWGRGPVRTTAQWAGPNMLVVLLEDGHTDQERALLAAGHRRELLEGRRVLHSMIERSVDEIVTRATHREVVTTLSATRLDPDMTAEIFLLGPAPSTPDTGGPAPGAESAAAAAGPATSAGGRAATRSEAGALRAEALQARRRRSELLGSRDGADPRTPDRRDEQT